ncbi:methyltransferase domain-containing protein [Microbacterium sp. CFH 31415]|uniref:class I SAM-dependent methyltransferase n=1 Tax=Microbacterium sp. CFH 31415 TaxID=2921732 RepID=UPI001F12EE1A|nr:class I SAM-dependent methyltransferase [Microbacterium sp. CFH 31415]MCH6232215.1 methyltransferase domain-containing protein [Microbacterium sp. CFH 31415]
MASRDEMSRSFGAAASAYESGRPDYPREAVEWLLAPVRAEGRALRVADVGAGTGKLTRTIVEAGADVVAIDPDPDMLATLRDNVHGVPTFVGTAERMPLPDASVDALLLGQAWHWVDAPVAAAECGRVLRSGGVLGLIWNVRDESDAFVSGLTAIMHASSAERMIAEGGPDVGEPIGDLEKRVWTWSRTIGRDALLDMVASRSYVITAPADERERILRGVGELFDGASRVTDSGVVVVDLPYRTEAFRGIRGIDR